MVLGRSSDSTRSLKETIHQTKQVQYDISALRDQIEELRAVVHAIWEVVRPLTKVNDDQLAELVQSLRSEQKGPRVAEKCAECSRSLQDSSDFCIYCGAKVVRREVF